jgi:alpha-amylase/alpha-mannosidase (GH57 family)
VAEQLRLCGRPVPRWGQEWRAPLREALDWLRYEFAGHYEAKAREYLNDPWRARDGYIDVVLDRSPETVDRFFQDHALRDLTGKERTVVLKLLELQRHAMLMYTSCGWFFDELSGIETMQVIRYAGRAIQLAEGLFPEGLEQEVFLERLAGAKAILRSTATARASEQFVKPR